MTRKAVEIKGLVKNYEDVEAVKGISFDIHEGEIFGFLGPNGAGKTTTINCITGLSTITSGNIKVYGNDVVKDYMKTRPLIGLSPQEFQFDIYFKVKEMLIFQAGYFGIKRKDAEKRADELLKLFNITDKAEKKARALSGGMKRRLSMAKAMMHDPKLLILDEPTAAMDIELRVEMWKYLKKLKKLGKTIILTTHYIEEAERLSDRIGIINKGKMLMIKPVKQIVKELGKCVIKVKASRLEIPEGISGEVKNGIIYIWTCDMKQVISAFQRENNPIIHIEEEKEKLEDIFLRITNGK